MFIPLVQLLDVAGMFSNIYMLLPIIIIVVIIIIIIIINGNGAGFVRSPRRVLNPA